MADFLEMGGYGAFVWPAYGLTFLVMALVLWASFRNLKNTQKDFEKLSSSDEKDREQP